MLYPAGFRLETRGVLGITVELSRDKQCTRTHMYMYINNTEQKKKTTLTLSL